MTAPVIAHSGTTARPAIRRRHLGRRPVRIREAVVTVHLSWPRKQARFYFSMNTSLCLHCIPVSARAMRLTAAFSGVGVLIGGTPQWFRRHARESMQVDRSGV